MVLTAQHQLMDSHFFKGPDLAYYMLVSRYKIKGRLGETDLPEAAYIASDIAWNPLILP